MVQLTRAERLLQELGVTEPKEIDLEAIAFHLGARVRFRRLDGCEARIIGCNDKAIITIHDGSNHRRKRFSLAHEIGHNAATRIMPHRAENAPLQALSDPAHSA